MRYKVKIRHGRGWISISDEQKALHYLAHEPIFDDLYTALQVARQIFLGRITEIIKSELYDADIKFYPVVDSQQTEWTIGKDYTLGYYRAYGQFVQYEIIIEAVQ